MLDLTAHAVTHQNVRDYEGVATHGEDGFTLQHKWRNPTWEEKTKKIKQIHNNRGTAYHLIQWGFFSIAEKAAYFFLQNRYF